MYYFSKKEKIFDEKEKEKFNVMTMGCEIKLEKVGSRKLDKRIEKKSFFVFIFHYLHVTDNLSEEV